MLKCGCDFKIKSLDPKVRGLRMQAKSFRLNHFSFHPDFTVDLGISPNHAQIARSWVITTDQELDAAILTLPRRSISYAKSINRVGGSVKQTGHEIA